MGPGKRSKESLSRIQYRRLHRNCPFARRRNSNPGWAVCLGSGIPPAPHAKAGEAGSRVLSFGHFFPNCSYPHYCRLHSSSSLISLSDSLLHQTSNSSNSCSIACIYQCPYFSLHSFLQIAFHNIPCKPRAIPSAITLTTPRT